jgi:hypothetical protein
MVSRWARTLINLRLVLARRRASCDVTSPDMLDAQNGSELLTPERSSTGALRRRDRRLGRAGGRVG